MTCGVFRPLFIACLHTKKLMAYLVKMTYSYAFVTISTSLAYVA